MADAVVGAGAGASGGGFGEQVVGDRWGGVKCAVGAVEVVDGDEAIDLVLEGLDGVGGVSGGEPALEGLLEAFDLSAGGGVVRAGVLLFDLEVDGWVSRWLRPPRPPAKRVVYTMALSVSTDGRETKLSEPRSAVRSRPG